MHHGQRIAVVVPAYREAERIGRVIARMPAYVDRIVVVDDGSDDGTATAAEATGDDRVRVLRHPENRGVGAAIASGYRVAFDEERADAAVVMAGDDQMHPDDLDALLAPLRQGVAYAKGNRLAWPGARRAMPVARYLGNHVLSGLTRLATGLAVHDSQCGYTALSARAAHLLDLEALWPRYGYPNDLLGALAARGLSVRDVPVRPIYAGEASGIGWRHALVVIPWVLARVIARRLRLALPAPARARASE